MWHVGPTQREETRGTQGRVAQAQWCQELRQPCCGGVSQSTFNKDTRVCERYVLLILSCVSVLFPAGAHNSSAGAGGRGRPTQFFSLGKKSRRHRSLWRVTLLKCVCLSASRPPPCPTACPSRGSLHRPLPKRTRTPPRSATARRSPCSGPPASPPSSQPPPTNTQLPSVRCASRVGRASQLRPLYHALSTTCSLLRAPKPLRYTPGPQAPTPRHPAALPTHALSTPHAIHVSRVLGAGSIEPSASAPPTTSARR